MQSRHNPSKYVKVVTGPELHISNDFSKITLAKSGAGLFRCLVVEVIQAI